MAPQFTIVAAYFFDIHTILLCLAVAILLTVVDVVVFDDDDDDLNGGHVRVFTD